VTKYVHLKNRTANLKNRFATQVINLLDSGTRILWRRRQNHSCKLLAQNQAYDASPNVVSPVQKEEEAFLAWIVFVPERQSFIMVVISQR